MNKDTTVTDYIEQIKKLQLEVLEIVEMMKSDSKPATFSLQEEHSNG